MKTKVEELPESKVRLEVEVPEADVRHAVEHAASDMAGSMRVPGFRKGKVPLPVVVARIGREAIMTEAVRSHIEGWFWRAADSSGIRPAAPPEVEYDDLPGEGDAFRFRATVPVVPEPELADWSGLEVPAAEPEVPLELVEAELERVRVTMAELVPAERPVREGDTVVVDLFGDEGDAMPALMQRDYVVEVGSSRLVDEIEATLPGMSVGETKSVDFELADDARGRVDVTVKDVKEKLLPPLDDELARSATEFDTLDELRADIERRLREQLESELEARFREAAVDALVAASKVEAPGVVVEARAAELWSGLARSLERRGVSLENYLALTGQTREQLAGRMREEAERSLRRELVLEAAAKKLGLEVGDEEIDAVIREQADEIGDDADEAVTLIRDSGGFEKLRGDLRLRKAVDEIVAGVKRIPVDLARAREKLWTPEKEKGGSGMKIWTPGSEEGR